MVRRDTEGHGGTRREGHGGVKVNGGGSSGANLRPWRAAVGVCGGSTAAQEDRRVRLCRQISESLHPYVRPYEDETIRTPLYNGRAKRHC